MIAELIIKYQIGCNEAAEEMIEKFSRLLRIYAFSLNYEDTYDDMIVEFINLLHTINLDHFCNINDGSLTSYIHKSVYSSYIKLLIKIKKERGLIYYSELRENELYSLELRLATYDETNELFELENILANEEWKILNLIFVYGYNAQEISNAWGISKQAVNQDKKRALGKIKYF